ncbi:unnamed protein product, partial [Didymodactylos carnosus]
LTVNMRSFQMMRYARRSTPTSHEIGHTLSQSTSLKHRASISPSVFSDTFNSKGYSSLPVEKSPSLVRRNTIANQKSLLQPSSEFSTESRRSSLTLGRHPSFHEIETSKSRSNLRNFYIFFVLLFLFIFTAVVYSFIRMVYNQPK